jgi:CRP-like cAMP-binding protein
LKTDEELQFLKKAFKAPHAEALVRHMDKKGLHDICMAMYSKRVDANEIMIAQGTRGGNFYIVSEGHFNAYVARHDDHMQPDHVKRYTVGESFGELTLLYGCDRQASVASTSAGAVFVLEYSTYADHFAPNPGPERYTGHAKLLAKTKLFDVLTVLEKQDLGLALGEELHGSGEVVCKAGEVLKFVYILLDGGVTIQTETGESYVVTEPGRVFGELTFQNKRSPCTAVANENGCSLLVLAVDRSDMLDPVRHDILRMSPSTEARCLW